MPITRKQLFAHLDRLEIAHKTTEHKAVFTVEDSAEVKAKLPGGHTKNLFLKAKAHEGVNALFLICALGDTPIRLNKLHPHLGSKRLSFGSEALLLETLGVPAGSVTLFSILNDTETKVQLVFDAALFEDPLVNFHPLINTATTTIASDRIIDFAKSTDHEPVILDFKACKPI